MSNQAEKAIEAVEVAAAAFYSFKGTNGALERALTGLDRLDRKGDPAAAAYTTKLLARLESIRVSVQS